MRGVAGLLIHALFVLLCTTSMTLAASVSDIVFDKKEPCKRTLDECSSFRCDTDACP
jgi:hypothetical protein